MTGQSNIRKNTTKINIAVTKNKGNKILFEQSLVQQK